VATADQTPQLRKMLPRATPSISPPSVQVLLGAKGAGPEALMVVVGFGEGFIAAGVGVHGEDIQHVLSSLRS
jgi:hypothetical protein